MPTDLPPNLTNIAASEAVRQADAHDIAERKAADDKRRREEALREAEARKRSAETSGR